MNPTVRAIAAATIIMSFGSVGSAEAQSSCDTLVQCAQQRAAETVAEAERIVAEGRATAEYTVAEAQRIVTDARAAAEAEVAAARARVDAEVTAAQAQAEQAAAPAIALVDAAERSVDGTRRGAEEFASDTQGFAARAPTARRVACAVQARSRPFLGVRGPADCVVTEIVTGLRRTFNGTFNDPSAWVWGSNCSVHPKGGYGTSAPTVTSTTGERYVLDRVADTREDVASIPGHAYLVADWSGEGHDGHASGEFAATPAKAVEGSGGADCGPIGAEADAFVNGALVLSDRY